MQEAASLEKDLKKCANPAKAEILQRFFKTKKGEYGFGDVFLGISVPKQRQIAKEYMDMPLAEASKLLRGKVHEYRLSALILLVEKYKKGDEKLKKQIVKTYFDNLKHINNWDLVDLSAPYILGDFFLREDKSRLKKMAKSPNLWEKRMAIISTFAFIRKNDFELTLQLAKVFLKDEHPLMHKATGWMLREVGKRDKKALCDFLDLNANQMPRIMLSYAIEKFDEKERKKFLKP